METIVSDETSSLSDAFQKLSKFEKVNFDETVEVSCSMGVDPKQSSQGVRGTVNLPHGSGKDVRVIVFTDNSLQRIKIVDLGNELNSYNIIQTRIFRAPEVIMGSYNGKL